MEERAVEESNNRQQRINPSLSLLEVRFFERSREIEGEHEVPEVRLRELEGRDEEADDIEP